MNDFIKFAAKQTYTQHNGDLSNVLILFPNRRSLLFFKKTLAEIAGKPVWAPQTFTLDGWIKQHSTLGQADELSLIIKLHECWKKMKQPDSFETFYSLGQILLKDFDRMRESKVNRIAFFSDLNALSEMETSYFEDSDNEALAILTQALKSSKYTTSISTLWGNLKDLDSRFEKALLSEGIGTPGMIYEEVLNSNKIETLSSTYDASYAIGFFMTSPLELSLLEGIRNLKFYWYKAAPTIVEALDWQHPMKPVIDSLYDRSIIYTAPICETAVSIYAASGQQQQVQQLSDILTKYKQGDLDEVAILLPEQGLLLPVLQALPDNAKSLNVSMGLSILDSGVYSLLDRFMQCLGSWNNRYLKINSFKYLAEHYLLSPFVIVNSLEFNEHNQYVHLEQFNELVNENWRTLLSPLNNPNESIERILELLKRVYDRVEDEMDQASIYGVYSAINRLQSVLDKTEETWSINFLNQFLKKIFQNTRIALSGEPLRGLQILGGQELINLDFNTLFIMEANEGILPGSNFQTLFPVSLCRLYKLPHINEFVERQEFVIWNAINGASAVNIFYNTSKQGISKSEPSRWVQRLLLGYHPETWKIEHHQIQAKSTIIDRNAIRIEQSESVKNHVLNWLQTERVSPTALNNWLQCKLKFYLGNVLKYKENQEDNEDMDAAKYGNILHLTLENLYQPYKSSLITEEIFPLIQAKVEEELKTAFTKVFRIPLYMVERGSNRIFFESLKLAIHKILALDIEHLPFQITSLEMQLDLAIENSITEQPIRFFGFVDRLDEAQGAYRIIDYKSGSNTKNHSNSKYENLWKSDGRNHKEALQALFYIWLYHRVNPDMPIPTGHLIFVRDKSNKGTAVHIDGQMNFNQSFLQSFETDLFEQIKEMLQTDFEQTSNKQVCRVCPYKEMCGR